MSTPFAMVGDPDAGACVDGACVLPTSSDDDAVDDTGTAASPEDERSRRDPVV